MWGVQRINRYCVKELNSENAFVYYPNKPEAYSLASTFSLPFLQNKEQYKFHLT